MNGKIIKKLPKKFHAHFSGIEYGPKGERKHLKTTKKFFEPLAAALIKTRRDITLICESPQPYKDAAMKYYGEWTDVIFHASRLCGEYGLDTMVIEPLIAWLTRCYQEGILNENQEQAKNHWRGSNSSNNLVNNDTPCRHSYSSMCL